VAYEFTVAEVMPATRQAVYDARMSDDADYFSGLEA
jgi:hypothetical protein